MIFLLNHGILFLLDTLIQILAWVAIPDETEEAEWGRNFTVGMGNKIMDGLWDKMEDN